MCYLVTYYLFIYFGLFVHPVGWNAIHVSMICSLLLYCHRQLRPLCAYSIVCAVWLLFTDLFPSFLVELEAWFCLHAITLPGMTTVGMGFILDVNRRVCARILVRAVYLLCAYLFQGFLPKPGRVLKSLSAGVWYRRRRNYPPSPLPPRPVVGAQGYQTFPLFKPGVEKKI